MSTGKLWCVFPCRLDLEWQRGRVFDSDVAAVFQRVVADAKVLRIAHVSSKEERRQRPSGESCLQSHVVIQVLFPATTHICQRAESYARLDPERSSL